MQIERTFILGLGHQKCGTGWLYKYLCQSKIFAEGKFKEYHVWDRLDIPLLQHLGRRRQKKLQQSPNCYFDYFDGLMIGGKSLTADITPSYSGLKAQRLQNIKQNFSKKNINVKVVILVREPLSRIKSAVRFNLDKKRFSEGISLNETDFESALNQYYKTEHCLFRTKYENIICEAKKIFSSENIYVGFYENMFDDDEVRRLSEFLQIDAKVEFANVRVNKTVKVVSQTESDSKIKAFYADTYKYFHKNFPITKDLWR